MTDNYELLRKIKALAEQGFGGESANAAAMLVKLCAKYGIDPNSLDSDRMVDRLFKTKGGEHERFVSQVISSVVGYRKQYTMGPKTTIVAMTDAEFIEADMKIDFYWADYQQQKKLFWAAYVQKQKLYVKPTPDGEKSSRNSDEAERVLRMAESIEQKNFQKRLES